MKKGRDIGVYSSPEHKLCICQALLVLIQDRAKDHDLDENEILILLLKTIVETAAL